MVQHILTQADSIRIITSYCDAIKSKQSVDMNDVQLLFMGVLGILTYCLKKAKELQNKGFQITPAKFVRIEWYSIASSMVLIFAALMLKKEAMTIDYASHFMGFCFFVIGYAGQNVLYAILGKVEKVTGLRIDDQDKNLDSVQEKEGTETK